MSKILFTPEESASRVLRFAISPTLLATLFSLWLLSMLIMVRADEPVSTSSPLPPVTFENAASEVVEEAGAIVATALQHFEKVTQRKTGNRPIRVRFVEILSARGMEHLGDGRIQGVTHHEADFSVIEISTRRTSSWGRTLAHELTHVFVREAYGKVANRTLNEGLAEYVAFRIFPSEVSRDLSNAHASLGPLSPARRPYVEGLRFVAQHASDKRFPNFFESAIKNPNSSYQDLKETWKTASALLVAKQSSN